MLAFSRNDYVFVRTVCVVSCTLCKNQGSWLWGWPKLNWRNRILLLNRQESVRVFMNGFCGFFYNFGKIKGKTQRWLWGWKVFWKNRGLSLNRLGWVLAFTRNDYVFLRTVFGVSGPVLKDQWETHKKLPQGWMINWWNGFVVEFHLRLIKFNVPKYPEIHNTNEGE